MNRLDDPVSDLATAIGHASIYFADDYPYDDGPNVFAMFPQMWGDSSLGFGGYGGQALTSAYTIVLAAGSVFNVYFGGLFAYSLQRPNHDFFQDISNGRLKSVSESSVYLDTKDPFSTVHKNR